MEPLISSSLRRHPDSILSVAQKEEGPWECSKMETTDESTNSFPKEIAWFATSLGTVKNKRLLFKPSSGSCFGIPTQDCHKTKSKLHRFSVISSRTNRIRKSLSFPTHFSLHNLMYLKNSHLLCSLALHKLKKKSCKVLILTLLFY